MKFYFSVLIAASVMIPRMAYSQQAMQDEAGVPSYTLPEILKTSAGVHVTSVSDWEGVRRPEILALFANEVYGNTPGVSRSVSYKVRSVDEKALNGTATRKEVTLRFADNRTMELLLYLPNRPKGKVPVFLGLNFQGNHTVTSEPGIRVTDKWVANSKEYRITDHKAQEHMRGSSSRRWPVEAIVARGYGVATIYYGDIFPDYPEGREVSMQTLFPEKESPSGWGAIATWAWGLSRALDYLESEKRVDAGRVVVTGHSRLGKAALWAGVQDRRFAIVISNNSGEGGAAITRRKFGETIQRINTSFPHWFAGNYKQYNNREEMLPVDYHQLLALVAPRPLYVASASKDLWADPRGEYLSARASGEVYKLYGKTALDGTEFPEPQKPIGGGAVGYHLREGVHDILLYDWEQYMNFADRHFKKK